MENFLSSRQNSEEYAFPTSQADSINCSWGLGKFYFNVQVQVGRLFQICFNRVPKDALDPKGQCMLLAKLEILNQGI